MLYVLQVIALLGTGGADDKKRWEISRLMQERSKMRVWLRSAVETVGMVGDKWGVVKDMLRIGGWLLIPRPVSALALNIIRIHRTFKKLIDSSTYLRRENCFPRRFESGSHKLVLRCRENKALFAAPSSLRSLSRLRIHIGHNTTSAPTKATS